MILAETAATRLSTKSLITVVSAIILVATEFVVLGVAAGWAIAGLLELGTLIEYILMALFGAIALWGSFKFARNAMRLEAAHSTD